MLSDRRWLAFEDVRNSAHEKLKEISQLYTIPSDDLNQPPHEKYTLRGVATGANVVYVLEKTVRDGENNISSANAKDWQWWKIEYLSTETNPVVPKASLPSMLIFGSYIQAPVHNIGIGVAVTSYRQILTCWFAEGDRSQRA